MEMLILGCPNFFTEGYIADTLKTRRPKLTHCRWELTVSNALSCPKIR